jgi:hypothetical protein
LENIREHAKYFPVKVRDGCEHEHYRYAYQRLSSNNDIGDYKNTDFWNYNSNSILFDSKQHYITPLYKMPLFKSLGYPDNLCPVCEEVDENIVLAWLKDSGM